MLTMRILAVHAACDFPQWCTKCLKSWGVTSTEALSKFCCNWLRRVLTQMP
jgi:hypothetical protein